MLISIFSLCCWKQGEDAKKVAEEKFKTIQDAHELLMDPQRRKLYDEGYDRDEIEQQMEMQKQGHGGGGGNTQSSWMKVRNVFFFSSPFYAYFYLLFRISYIKILLAI